jgi:large subunit ribosomal protein L25
MDMIPLQVSARDPKISPARLREQGHVPCVMYGNNMKTTSLAAEARALHKAFAKAGESTLVELEMGSEKVPVLFKDIDFDPVSGREIHADFYAVNMKEEIETQVPIKLEGEAPAIKELGGVLVTPVDHVTVRCLPADLPHELTVSVASLAAFHDAVTIANIKLPKGITVLESPDTVLATIQEPRKEEEIAPPPAAEGVPAEGAAVEGAVPGAEVVAAPGAEAAGAAPEKATGKEKK